MSLLHGAQGSQRGTLYETLDSVSEADQLLAKRSLDRRAYTQLYTTNGHIAEILAFERSFDGNRWHQTISHMARPKIQFNFLFHLAPYFYFRQKYMLPHHFPINFCSNNNACANWNGRMCFVLKARMMHLCCRRCAIFIIFTARESCLLCCRFFFSFPHLSFLRLS